MERFGYAFAVTLVLGAGLTACSTTVASTSRVYESPKADSPRVAFVSPDEQQVARYKNILNELKSTNNPPPAFDYNVPPAKDVVAFQPAVSGASNNSCSVEAERKAAENLAAIKECLNNHDYAEAARCADEMIDNAKLAGNPKTVKEAELLRSQIWLTSGY